MEGFEPSSKHGTNQLSTRLALHHLSAIGVWPKQPTLRLSSEMSPQDRGTPLAIPDISAPPVRTTSGTEYPGDVSSLSVSSDEASTYYSSVTQREQNCFRHLKGLKSEIKVPGYNALRAYGPLRHAVKSSHPRNFLLCKVTDYYSFGNKPELRGYFSLLFRTLLK